MMHHHTNYSKQEMTETKQQKINNKFNFVFTIFYFCLCNICCLLYSAVFEYVFWHWWLTLIWVENYDEINSLAQNKTNKPKEISHQQIKTMNRKIKWHVVIIIIYIDYETIASRPQNTHERKKNKKASRQKRIITPKFLSIFFIVVSIQ